MYRAYAENTKYPCPVALEAEKLVGAGRLNQRLHHDVAFFLLRREHFLRRKGGSLASVFIFISIFIFTLGLPCMILPDNPECPFADYPPLFGTLIGS